jgi:succinoglycan biosynthesis protein ExoM
MKSFKGTVRPTTRTETPVQPGSRDPLSQKLTNLLTVVIPSIGRPSLKNAIESCLGQDLPSKHKMEVVVVDNTMTGELRELIDHYTNRDPRIRYVHQPCKGFSCARNTGVEQGLGTYVAFLDDDEEACSGWAAALLRQAHRGACAVFGPIRASFDAPLEYPEAERLFSRNLRCRDGSDVTRYRVNLGTGNSLFDRDVCFTSRPFFATELNHIGGEDSEFLMRLVDRGVRLIWAADALVVEHVPSHRVDPLRLSLRRFRNGQVRSLVCFRSGGLRTLGGIAWMAAGVAQIVLFGLLSIVCQAFDHKRALHFRLKAAGGLGKVLWMRSFWMSSCDNSV